jgi:hypothetical protein
VALKAALESSSAGQVVPAELLIGPLFRDFTKAMVQSDQTLDLYLHRNGQPITIKGGTFGSQLIDPLPVDQELDLYIQSTVRRLDALLALNFRFVDSPDLADVSIYLDSTIDLGDFGGTTLGIALSNQVDGKLDWEIVFNGTVLASQPNYRHYTVVHELLHVLGLEHPFDDSDGDVYLSNNYRESAYPKDTVMAYRRPDVGDWPSWISTSDQAALISIWGGAPVNRFQGTPDNDDIIGTLQADELRGGGGSNRYLSPEDESTDWLVITPDNPGHSMKANARVDVITEIGATDEIVILGARKRDLRFRPVRLKQTPYGNLEGTGVFVSNKLEVVYTGDAFNQQFIALITSAVPPGFIAPL